MIKWNFDGFSWVLTMWVRPETLAAVKSLLSLAPRVYCVNCAVKYVMDHLLFEIDASVVCQVIETWDQNMCDWTKQPTWNGNNTVPFLQRELPHLDPDDIEVIMDLETEYLISLGLIEE